VGDIFFDRQIRKMMYENGEDYVFSCISGFLKEADLIVGNLEGPITENASVSLFTTSGSDNNYVFTFPTNVAKLLAKNNIKMVNLGNNHINNFGKEGISSTKKYLDEAGVDYFGGAAGDESVYRAKIAGIKVSFISYNEFDGDSASKVVQKIDDEKSKGQMVFVYTHWGDEYILPPVRVKNYAKMFAQAGADLVIGSHPHVILPSEKIGETIIYYSLGNFIFDQYWNKNVSTGLVLEVVIKRGEINIIEHKVSLNRDGRTCLVDL